MKVYLTGPVSNLLYSEESDWRIALAGRLTDKGIECSWGARLRDYESFRDSAAAAFFEKKFEPVRNVVISDFNKLLESDVLFVNFVESPHQPALGACIEIGRADAYGIKIVAAVAPESVHDHIAILEACDYVFLTVDDAVSKLVELSKSIL